MSSTTASRKARGAENRAKALQLRIEGLTFVEIGRRLECSQQMAHKHVKKALAELAEQTLETAAELRRMELATLERMHRRLWPDFEDGSIPAANTLLRISERRSRLLGLDAPDKVAPTNPAGDLPYDPAALSDDERLSRIAQLLAEGEAARAGRADRGADGDDEEGATA